MMPCGADLSSEANTTSRHVSATVACAPSPLSCFSKNSCTEKWANRRTFNCLSRTTSPRHMSRRSWTIGGGDVLGCTTAAMSSSVDSGRTAQRIKVRVLSAIFVVLVRFCVPIRRRISEYNSFMSFGSSFNAWRTPSSEISSQIIEMRCFTQMNLLQD